MYCKHTTAVGENKSSNKEGIVKIVLSLSENRSYLIDGDIEERNKRRETVDLGFGAGSFARSAAGL